MVSLYIFNVYHVCISVCRRRPLQSNQRTQHLQRNWKTCEAATCCRRFQSQSDDSRRRQSPKKGQISSLVWREKFTTNLFTLSLIFVIWDKAVQIRPRLFNFFVKKQPDENSITIFSHSNWKRCPVNCWTRPHVVFFLLFQGSKICDAPVLGLSREAAGRSVSADWGLPHFWARSEPHLRYSVLAGWGFLQWLLEVKGSRSECTCPPLWCFL